MNAISPNDYGKLGPAMLALSEGWRSFVYHYVRADPKRGSLVAAARAAGYCKGSTPAIAAKFAWKLSRDERVIAAIAEESRKILKVAFPQGANALLKVVQNSEHPQHIKAISMLLERTMPVESRSFVEVTHRRVDPDVEALEELAALRAIGATREKLIELFGSNGLARLERLEATDKLRRASEARVIEHSVADARHEHVVEDIVQPDDDEEVAEVAPEDDF